MVKKNTVTRQTCPGSAAMLVDVLVGESPLRRDKPVGSRGGRSLTSKE